MASGLPNDTGHDFIHAARGSSECAAIKEDEREGDCADVGDAYEEEEKDEKVAAYRFCSPREHRPSAGYSNSDAPHGDCSRQSLDQIATCHGEADRQNYETEDCEKTTFAELPAYVRQDNQQMQLPSLSERDDSDATTLPEPPSRSARSSISPSSTTRRRRQGGCSGRGGQCGRRGRSSGKRSRLRRERSGSATAAARKTSSSRRPVASTSRMERSVRPARERSAARRLPTPKKNFKSDAASLNSARIRRSSRCRSRSASRSKSASRKHSRSRSASSSKRSTRSGSATRRKRRAPSRSGSRERRRSVSATRRKCRATSRSGSRERRRSGSAGRRPSRGRDPGKPKRPVSAFILFLNEFRKENADKYRGSDVRDLTKIGGQVWRNMSLKKKCEYQQESNRLHDMYTEQMKQYRAEVKANTSRRRPETAYQVFLRKFYSEHKNDRRCPTPRDVLIKGARKWRRMTLREKMPFMDFSEEDPINEPKISRSQEAGDLDIHFVDECQHEDHAAPHSDYGCGPDEHVAEEIDVHATPSMQLASDNHFDRAADDAAHHFVVAPPSEASDGFVASDDGKGATFAIPHPNDMTAHRKTGGIMEFLSHRFRGDHYAGRR